MHAKREEEALPAAGEAGPWKQRGPSWGRLLMCGEGSASHPLGKKCTLWSMPMFWALLQAWSVTRGSESIASVHLSAALLPLTGTLGWSEGKLWGLLCCSLLLSTPLSAALQAPASVAGMLPRSRVVCLADM